MVQEKKTNNKKKYSTQKQATKKNSEVEKKNNEKELVKTPKKIVAQQVEEPAKTPVTAVKGDEKQDIVLGLNRESQKNYKILTRIVAVLAMIGRVLTIIAIPLIAIAALFFTIVLGKVDYTENRLYFNDKEVAVFENDEEGVVLKINAVIDGKNITIRDNLVLKELQILLTTISKNMVISSIIFVAIFFIASLVIWIFIYRRLEELFNHLNTEDTPFTETNTLLIKEIGKLLIISAIVVAAGNGILQLMLHANLSLNNGTINIVEILIVYTLYYVFKYGTKMQSKSNMRLTNK